MKTAKGEFKATLAAIQLPKAVVVARAGCVHTPLPVPIVRPKPTPAPYVDNRPLAPELVLTSGVALI